MLIYVLGLFAGIVTLVFGILYAVGVFDAEFEQADTAHIVAAVFLIGAVILIFRQPPSGD